MHNVKLPLLLYAHKLDFSSSGGSTCMEDVTEHVFAPEEASGKIAHSVATGFVLLAIESMAVT
jgi:hypothetical protein